MHITLARPTVSVCCAHHVAPQSSEETCDAFVSNLSLGELEETRSLAALALSVKRNSAKSQLPADLAAVVRTELGEAGITSIRDERLQQLQGFFIQGVEIPSFDPVAVLGEGWEVQHGTYPSKDGPVGFSRFGDKAIQHLSFDVESGSFSLHTVHQESFVSTRHYTITEERDGKIAIRDEFVS